MVPEWSWSYATLRPDLLYFCMDFIFKKSIVPFFTMYLSQDADMNSVQRLIALISKEDQPYIENGYHRMRNLSSFQTPHPESTLDLA